MKTIRIDISIPIRRELVALEGPKIPGGFPEKMGTISRVSDFHTVVIDKYKIAIGPNRDLKTIDPNFDSMLLSIRCNQVEFDDALKSAQPTIELVFDYLSFQMQEMLFPISLNLMDVTPKLSLGEERDFTGFTDPASILLPKYFSSQIDFRFNSQIDSKPSLANFSKPNNRNDQVSLWWYLRALQSPLIDQINYLFIILDNISKPYKKGPYKTDCNHEIKNCPECNKLIEKQLAGDSIKGYLTDNGFSFQEAKNLWDFRQIVHGKDLFNYNKLQEISSLVNRLKVLIFNKIKSKLNMSENDLPIINSLTGPVISQNMTLNGKCKLDDFDLKIEQAFDLV